LLLHAPYLLAIRLILTCPLDAAVAFHLSDNREHQPFPNIRSATTKNSMKESFGYPVEEPLKRLFVLGIGLSHRCDPSIHLKVESESHNRTLTGR
jgi:hypothetical protein